jgi:NCS1 family nucleobase:cation symporter-1
LYNLGFFYGFGAACLSYYVICYFFPAKETYVDAPVYMVEDNVSFDDLESSSANEKSST